MAESLPSPDHPLLPGSGAAGLVNLLATLSLAGSLVITLRTWAAVAEFQETWPLPALYFLELVALPAVAAFFAFRRETYLSRVAFAAAGAMLAFCLIGAWSIGLLYLLPAILVLLLGLTSREVSHEPWTTCAAFLIGLAILQGAVMIAVIQLR